MAGLSLGQAALMMINNERYPQKIAIHKQAHKKCEKDAQCITPQQPYHQRQE